MLRKSEIKAHDKYVKDHYAAITVKFPRELMDQFKALTQANGDSMRQVLKQAIENYVSEHGGAV